MEKLFKFHLPYGRMGDVEGVFIATDAQINKALGQRVYFGEVLGKHSEVYTDLSIGQITFVTDDPNVIEIVKTHKLESGYNPLEYIEYEETEDETPNV